MKTNKSNLTFKSFRSFEGKNILKDLANLRIEVFREFPYLYEGDMDYEEKYLNRYFSAQNSYVFCAYDQNQLVGATTAILLSEEDEMIKGAFRNTKFTQLDSIVYFGESLVLLPYRKQGLGKTFFQNREEFALSIPQVKWTTFCAVIRPDNDPRRPNNYYSPESLWIQMGYKKMEQLTTEMSWQEIGEVEIKNNRMQFWMKPIR